MPAGRSVPMPGREHAVGLRILTLTNFYPPHHYGGYELSCRDVMDRFRERGHTVSVLASDVRVDGVDDPTDEQADGVHRDLRVYWDDHELVSPPPWRRMQVERHNHRVLDDVVNEVRPDVVSVWNMGAVSLGLLTELTERSVPLVLNVCNDWLVTGPLLDAWQRMFRGRPRLAAAVHRLTGVPTSLPDLGAEVACFVSDHVRREAEERTPWTFSRGVVVHSGIERSAFEERGEAGDPSWSWRLLYVGRLDSRKGVDTLVDAMARLPADTTLEILGRGDPDYERDLRRRIDELGLGRRVTIAVAERGALGRHYRHADVVVFPSEWDEPFGLVPLEAMACGTPVVATGTGGSGEFLDDGVNCLLYPPGDATALAMAVERLASDAALRARLRSRGLTSAEEFDVDRLADRLERWHSAAATGATA